MLKFLLFVFREGAESPVAQFSFVYTRYCSPFGSVTSGLWPPLGLLATGTTRLASCSTTGWVNGTFVHGPVFGMTRPGIEPILSNLVARPIILSNLVAPPTATPSSLHIQ